MKSTHFTSCPQQHLIRRMAKLLLHTGPGWFGKVGQFKRKNDIQTYKRKQKYALQNFVEKKFIWINQLVIIFLRMGYNFRLQREIHWPNKQNEWKKKNNNNKIYKSDSMLVCWPQTKIFDLFEIVSKNFKVHENNAYLQKEGKNRTQNYKMKLCNWFMD